MKAETIGGAAIAALNCFGSAVLALFMQNDQLTLDQISQAAWISMGLGAFLQFLKDYQAISTRRLLERARELGGGTARSPWYIGLFAGLVLLLGGCASNPNNLITAGGLTVKQATAIVRQGCQAEVPDGPCRGGSLISSDQRDEAKAAILATLDVLDAASRFADKGEALSAITMLEQADILLEELSKLLTEWGLYDVTES